MIELLVLIAVLAIFCVTLYGGALIIVEHFWIGLFLLVFLTPIFLVWAFFRGIIGNDD